MKSAVICFTAQGCLTALRAAQALEKLGERPEIWCKKKDYQPPSGVKALEGTLRRWVQERFASRDALLFVGATGIAVRAIAPFLESKTKDPAVLVTDEKGNFLISLVSGHIGGANELCRSLAEGIGAIPVITTATDLNHKFAVDVFARKNGLWISDMKLAKQISAALLDGERVEFSSQLPVSGPIPPELVDSGKEGSEGLKIRVTLGETEDGKDRTDCLNLIPSCCVLGVGCRKGKTLEELEPFLLGLLQENGISIRALRQVCSVDRKADEQGILEFCQKYGLPFETYPAEELWKVPGDFQSSSFVAGQVGVDNVCERSAVRGSMGGTLIVRKTAESGMTAAVALENRRIYFE